jgi:HK97 gp10 family phage protein
MAIDYTLQGADQLITRLKGLSYDIRYKGGRSALRKSATVVSNAARANAQSVDDPSTPTSIAKNITLRFSPRVFKRSGDLQFRVGVLGGARGYAAASGEVKGRGKGNPGGDTFYWRFLEFGTQNMPAKPFIRRALSDNVEKSMSTFISEYNRALDRALRKLKK